jgi:signal transduction histidine kinase
MPCTWSDRSLRLLGLLAVGWAAILGALVPLLARGVDSQGVAREAAFDPYDLAIGFAFACAGSLLIWKRPRNPIGWLLVAFFVLGAVSGITGVYALRGHAFPDENLPGISLALMPASSLWPAQLFLPATVLLVLYPTGRLPARWWWWVNWSAAVGMAFVAVGLATQPEAADDWWPGARPAVTLPMAVGGSFIIAGGLLLVGAGVVSVVGTLMRTWRASYPERQQLLLLLTTGALAVLLAFLSPSALVFDLALISVPFVIAIGVLRYRLLGIEVVVRRALLYGALTGVVIAVFVGVTAALSTAVPEGWAPQLVAAALVATCLLPARAQMQGLVDRVVYGDRRDPIGAVTRLGAQVMETKAAEPLREVLAALAAALRTPYAALRDSDRTILAQSGLAPPSREVVAVFLRFGGQPLGELLLATRSGERRLPTPDRRLVDALLPQVAFVVYVSRLNADLEAARERAVLTGLAERDRIRRDLHDGLGPSLSGVALGLEAAETALRSADQATATALTTRLRREVQAAVEEVRRIIDGLRPPVLDKLGLVTALRQRAESVTLRSGGRLQVRIDAPDSLPPLSNEVEQAAYRIADEALTNVVRHSGATSCVLRIRPGDELILEVVDDGCGIPTTPRPGVGLESMRARAEALGGSLQLDNGDGTRVAAHLPLAQS